jgi:hypothetical protein
MNKKALIIGTEVATNSFESGASLRVLNIQNILVSQHFEVTIVPRKKAKVMLTQEWDLIVLVSFATAKLLRKSRKKTENLWFDPTDSWCLTRISLFKSGDIKQIILLVRDLLTTWTAPRIDLITFISRRDSELEKNWWSKRSQAKILPILDLDRDVNADTSLRLVFVGDGDYLPNRNAIRFLEKLPQFLDPGTEIYLIGKNLENSNSAFVNLGYVSAEDVYRKGDVHLAPISEGAGMKIKVAVPLWNGLRVIATEEAAIGFCLTPQLFIARTPLEFAKVINRLGRSSVDPFHPREAIFLDSDMEEIRQWVSKI